MWDEGQHKASEEVYRRSVGDELSLTQLSKLPYHIESDLVSFGACTCLLGTCNMEYVSDIFLDAFEFRSFLLQPEFVLISSEHFLL